MDQRAFDRKTPPNAVFVVGDRCIGNMSIVVLLLSARTRSFTLTPLTA